jgi:hypothetical protein
MHRPNTTIHLKYKYIEIDTTLSEVAKNWDEKTFRLRKFVWLTQWPLNITMKESGNWAQRTHQMNDPDVRGCVVVDVESGRASIITNGL